MQIIGEIKVAVTAEGNVGVVSSFDTADTIVLLNKALLGSLSQPFKPKVKVTLPPPIIGANLRQKEG